MTHTRRKIIKDNRWRSLKLILLAFVIILIPVYWHYYGLQNFLWLSDIGLFLTIIALCISSSLIMSMAAVGVLALELVWWVDFFVELLTGVNLIKLSDYMFNSSYPLMLRALSLFHIATPIIWILYLKRRGYDRRAFYYFTLLYWIVLAATYLLTDPQANINWVFLPTIYNLNYITQPVWLLILALGFPLCIFLPTHLLYKRMFKNPKQKNP